MVVRALCRQARIGLVAAVAAKQTPLVFRIVARPNLVSSRTLSATRVFRDDGYYRPLPPAPDVRPSRQLFIGNIPFAAKEADISAAAASFGNIENVRLIIHPDGSSRGFGYVTFSEQADADRCLQNGLEIHGRGVRVNYQDPSTARANAPPTGPNPPGRVLFLGGLPDGATEPDLRALFAPFGTLTSLRIPKRPTGEPRGFAHVAFEREADAVACFERFIAEPLVINFQVVNVNYAAARKTTRVTNPPTHKLYFYDYREDEAALMRALGGFGRHVQRLHFLRNPENNATTGSGFVEFDSVSKATQVLQEVSEINLEYAIDKRRTPPSHSGYGSPPSGYGPGARSPSGSGSGSDYGERIGVDYGSHIGGGGGGSSYGAGIGGQPRGGGGGGSYGKVWNKYANYGHGGYRSGRGQGRGREG